MDRITKALNTTLPPPPITWAQNYEVVFVNICIDDCKVELLEIDDLSIHFKGNGGPDKIDFECVFDFYDDVARYRQIPNDRRVELVIEKKDATWWPRLVKRKLKIPYITIDFHKWKDEDEIIGGDSDKEWPTFEWQDGKLKVNKREKGENEEAEEEAEEAEESPKEESEEVEMPEQQESASEDSESEMPELMSDDA